MGERNSKIVKHTNTHSGVENNIRRMVAEVRGRSRTTGDRGTTVQLEKASEKILLVEKDITHPLWQALDGSGSPFSCAISSRQVEQVREEFFKKETSARTRTQIVLSQHNQWCQTCKRVQRRKHWSHSIGRAATRGARGEWREP